MTSELIELRAFRDALQARNTQLVERVRFLESEGVAEFAALPEEVRAIGGVVLQELMRARAKHAPMHSAHEGYAVISEELDELWDEIKNRNPSRIRLLEEGIQVSAMGMRFLIDVVRNGA